MTGGGPPTPADPVVSVVLCTHDGSATILEQVDAVLAQRAGVPFELVVVDNDSDDGVGDLVRRHTAGDPRVSVVHATGRRTLGHARNVGALTARGTYLTFVDDDDRVALEWLAALVADLAHHPVVAMRLVLDEINDRATARSRSHPQVRGIEWFFGVPVASFIALRREDFLAVGGNDEDLRSAEDVDFAIRLHQALGHVPHWCADVVYHYRLRSSPRLAYRQGRSYGLVMPTVYRRWRHHLDPPPPAWAAAVRDWGRLVAMTPLCVVDRERRLRWAFRSGLRLGRLRGSLREWVVFL